MGFYKYEEGKCKAGAILNSLKNECSTNFISNEIIVKDNLKYLNRIS